VSTRLAVVGAFAAAAGAIALALAAGGADDGTPARVERLVPPERLGGRTVAALSLVEDGRERLYLRSKGLWRARDSYGAVCDASAVEAFLRDVLQARGVALPGDGAQALASGAPGALRVALHGPRVLAEDGGDVLAAVEYAAPASGAAFARLDGDGRVLAVDGDPRRRLEEREPFLDRRVLAGIFTPEFAGFERIFVDTADSGFELDSETPAAGEQRAWFVVSGGARSPASFWRVGGYVSLWVRLRWDEVLDPRAAAGLGLDPPLARITLQPSAGAPFEVRVAAPDAAGRLAIQNGATGVVMAVRADLLPLVVPAASELTREDGANPWEAWLAPR
jgi:hypothetical protein